MNYNWRYDTNYDLSGDKSIIYADCSYSDTMIAVPSFKIYKELVQEEYPTEPIEEIQNSYNENYGHHLSENSDTPIFYRYIDDSDIEDPYDPVDPYDCRRYAMSLLEFIENNCFPMTEEVYRIAIHLNFSTMY